MTGLLRPCLNCGRLSSGTRCRACTAVRESARQVRRREVRPHTAAEDRRRAEAVRLHVESFGYVCPGWRRPAHEARDLTADHVIAFARSGSEASPLAVLCRSCNASKGADGDAA